MRLQDLLLHVARIGVLAWCASCNAADVVIAQLVPLSGPVAEPGRQFAAGASLYFDHVNANGGIEGRHIRHLKIDDQYDPHTCVARLDDILSQPVLPAALLTFGTASTLAVSEELEHRHVRLAVFPTGSGSASLRKPFNRNLFHVRASYTTEFEKLIKGFAGTGIKSYAVVYQDDAFGRDALHAVQETLAALKLPAALEFRHDRSQLDISGLADAAARSSPEVVLLANNPGVAATFIKRAHANGLRSRLVATSDLDSRDLIRGVGLQASRYVVLSQSLPDPTNETKAMVAAFARLARAAKLPQNAYTLEGYVQARVIVEGLRRSSGNAPSLVDALETINGLDLGGYLISYGKSSHEGAYFVDTAIISADGQLMR
jgi:branched-chain amino acid transport system substrate-binding protein